MLMVELPERLRCAADRVSRHCFHKPGDTALMTIPADPERDVDLLLCQAADKLDALAARLAYVTQTLAPLVDDDNRPVEALARHAVARLAEAERLLREAHEHVPTTGYDDLDVRIYDFFGTDDSNTAGETGVKP